MQVWCPYLVGRDAELSLLRERLAAAREGRGGVVFVSGPAGMGKSRLARELSETARGDGAAVFTGRAVPGAGPVPYRPVAEVLAQALRGKGVPAGQGLDAWLPALRVMLPVIDAGAAATDTGIGPHTCGEALLQVLRTVRGDGASLVVLEDLGWADPDTVALVEYLADNLANESLLCVATVRPEPADAAWVMARRVVQRGAATHVPLEPLSDVAVAEMVLACVPDAGGDVVARVQATAEGVPLLVEEVLATPGVPATIDDAVRQRVAALSAEESSVLFAAAVLGRDFDWELLAPITGLPNDAVLAALERLVDALLISVDGDQFTFRHALTREAVVAAMLPPRRAALAKVALETVDRIRPGHDFAELALQAGDRARAAALLAESGRQSLRQGALGTAAAALRRAVDLTTDPAARSEAQGSLVTTLALAGRLDEALEVGEDLLARLGTGASATAAVHLDLARAAVAATRWPTARTHLDTARGILAARPDPRLSAQASALAAEVALADGDLEEARRSAGAALDAAQRLDMPEISCHALELIGRSHRVRDLDAARSAFARAYETAQEADLPVWRLRALHELGTIDLLDHSGTDTLHAAREQAERVGAHSVAAVIDVQLAAAYAPRFELASARTCARRAATLSRRLRLEQVHAMALFFDANVSLLKGNRAEFDDLIAEALRVTPDNVELDGLVWTVRGLNELLWGDRATAGELLDRGIARLMTVPAAAPTPAWGLRGLLHAVLRRPDAADCIEQARGYGATVARMNRGYLHYAEAVLTRSPAEVAAGDADLAHVPVWRQFGRVQLAEAALADGWGTPRAWLADARTSLEAHGLLHLARNCTRLLGDPPRSAPAGVTEREREVLELIAEGLTNREIAARLHLSVRTVEKHVESLLRKAGARSRTQLVAQLRKNT